MLWPHADRALCENLTVIYTDSIVRYAWHSAVMQSRSITRKPRQIRVFHDSAYLHSTK
jgi:hypothetical protein